MSKLLNYLGRSMLRCRPDCRNRLQNYATRKRFYRSTGIVQNDSKWEVTLDNRRLKTANGKMLVLDSELLARAIAFEWDAQTEVISQPTMHLTALCNTALDNPGNLSRHDIVHYLLEYLPTDTLLFYSEEEELQLLQKKKWGAVLDWFDKRYGIKLEVSHGLEPHPISTDAQATLARHLLSYDFTSLNAMTFGTEALKSPILMLACMERQLEPAEAVLLARLEEEFQSQQWGRVPWAHELSQAELTSRVAASVFLIHCSIENHSKAIKIRQREES